MPSYKGKPIESKIYPTYQFKTAIAAADATRKWLKKTGKQTTILIEQNRNLGDTLHLTPVIRHFRLKYPDAAIAFMVGRQYSGAHEFNPHVDKIFCTEIMKPPGRIALRKHLLKFTDITHVIAPSIFPYAAVWKELQWSYADIASQYFANSGIGVHPQGGRKLVSQITDKDVEWARQFMRKNNLRRNRTCVIEYNSYSGQPVWRSPEFRVFVKIMSTHNIKCISVAGKKEKSIGGSVDATGITWRQTVALMNEVEIMVGVGSGVTMLAAAAENVPHIIEIAVDDPVNMKGCGYADSTKIINPKPKVVANHIWDRVLNG